MALFVDTNILVYAEDRDTGRKHEIARDLILRLWDEDAGVLSVQVLQEYYVTVTQKLPNKMPLVRAQQAVREYLTWKVVRNTGELLIAAIELQRAAKLSFWDAMVVQAALDMGCEHLYTEDLNHGQRFGDLVVVDPFA